MKKEFWEIFKDDDEQLFEILGKSINDTQLTNNTAEMQDHGINVRCETAPASTSLDSIKSNMESYGYRYEEGLYRRRLADLQRLRSR